MKNIGDEIEFKKDGIIQTRAQEVVQKATDLLIEIEREGLFTTLEKGKFGGIKRSKTGGKGLSGVALKDEGYFNPFIELMLGGDR